MLSFENHYLLHTESVPCPWSECERANKQEIEIPALTLVWMPTHIPVLLWELQRTFNCCFTATSCFYSLNILTGFKPFLQLLMNLSFSPQQVTWWTLSWLGKTSDGLQLIVILSWNVKGEKRSFPHSYVLISSPMTAQLLGSSCIVHSRVIPDSNTKALSSCLWGYNCLL